MEPKLTLRFCHIKKKQKEFGFNLASKQFDLCKYVGKVDYNSPAYLAGLRQNDRIIEINNISVSNLNYLQILKLIKDGYFKENGKKNSTDEVLLLVVDKQTDEYYKKMNVTIRADDKRIPIAVKIEQSTTPVDIPPPTPPRPVESSSNKIIKNDDNYNYKRKKDCIKTKFDYDYEEIPININLASNNHHTHTYHLKTQTTNKSNRNLTTTTPNNNSFECLTFV